MAEQHSWGRTPATDLIWAEAKKKTGPELFLELNNIFDSLLRTMPRGPEWEQVAKAFILLHCMVGPRPDGYDGSPAA